MIPIIAIVGRPNVGKSTLFNYLTRTTHALVSDLPGVTRDRQYGKGNFEDWQYIIIDTGGLTQLSSELEQLMNQQTQIAVAEADIVLFLVDGRAGLNPDDKTIVEFLRKSNKKVYLLVNKVDGLNSDMAVSVFHELGFGEPIPIASAHGHGVHSLLSTVFADLPKYDAAQENLITGIKIAFVGKPNVGKSTLVNRILGADRVIVSEIPGTTRDSIFIPFTRRKQEYVLIDTAGVRRRTKVANVLEKFSIIKTLQAIVAANVVVIVIDAHSGIADQDSHLLGICLEEGKALVIAINKWDNMSQYQRNLCRKELERKLAFVNFVRMHFISALHGTGVGNIFTSINEAYQSAMKKIATPRLNKILQDAVLNNQPPMIHRRRIKLRYAHLGGSNPPIIVIHGTQTQHLPDFYRKYLENEFRRRLNLPGTPIRIFLRNSENPYKSK